MTAPGSSYASAMPFRVLARGRSGRMVPIARFRTLRPAEELAAGLCRQGRRAVVEVDARAEDER